MELPIIKSKKIFYKEYEWNKNLNNIVVNARYYLAKKYDVTNVNSEYFKYRGLCYKASNIVKYHLKYGYGSLVSVKIVHGEQRHRPIINSKYWIYEHTWLEVTFNGKKYYVDPTSSQFQCLYGDIPDFYISKKRPIWYLPDKRNICFHPKAFRFLNEKFFIKVKRKDKNGNKECIHFGIIEFLVYYVWGGISDKIRSIMLLMGC